MPITEMTQDTSIDQLLLQLDKLHSSPAIALRIMELTKDDDFEFHEIALCLEHDPALAASILRLVNSSYYGLVDSATSLPHALAYLGRKSLRLAVLSFGLVKSLINGAPAQFHQMYWKRSLTMAAVARQCALLIDSNEVDRDTAYAAGLLSDLGMLAVAQVETDTYVEISNEPDHVIELVKAEREAFGFDHMAVGEKLLSNWGMPKEIIEAVASHHTYLPLSPKLNHVLLVSNLLTEALWTPASPYMKPLQLVMIQHLGLGIDDIISLAMRSKADVLESMSIFNVRIRDEIDLESVETEARELYTLAAKESSSGEDFLTDFLAI